MRTTGILAFGVAVAVSAVLTAGEDQKRVSAGRDTFQTYCATCHGTSADGNGVLSKALRKQPPNLTQLSKQADGVFQEAAVFKAIEGIDRRPTSDMPAWRDALSRTQEKPNPEQIKATITALVNYLETIQEKP